jgi:GNAT superfamily N-acetyltransferase
MVRIYLPPAEILCEPYFLSRTSLMAAVASGRELARAYKPYIETCVVAFGPDRGMIREQLPAGRRQFKLRRPVEHLQTAGRPRWRLSVPPTKAFVRRGYRRQGVTTQLIFAALKTAKRARAPALEGYPIDTSAPKSTSNIFTGTAAAFARGIQGTASRCRIDHALGCGYSPHSTGNRTVYWLGLSINRGNSKQ